MTDRITSTSNPRVKALARLRNARERRDTGLFLIEGIRELQRALGAGVPVTSALWCASRLDERSERLLASLPAEVELIEMTPAPFEKIAYRSDPPGVIGVARQPATGLDRIHLGPTPLVLISESVEKPGNLGAMLRTADAAAVTAVVVADPTVDLFNPNVVRASQGALFTVPLAVARTAAVLEWAASYDIELFAGLPDAATSYWAVDLTGRVGLVVGREDRGLTPIWRPAATAVSIPMQGDGDSLNTATAAALLLFEAVRQRGAADGSITAS